jgi:hypothetical protein
MSQEPQVPMTHTNGNGTVPRLPQLRVHAFLAEGSPFRLPKFLTIEDAATVSGIPVARLAHFVEVRAMPFVRIDEGPLLFYEPDLRAFVRTLIRIVEPTGPIPEPICIYTDSFPPPTSIPTVLGRGFDGLVQLLLRWPEHGRFWREHADELVAEYVQTYPGHRPAGWWEHDALEPRRWILNGAAVPPDIPSDWQRAWRELRGIQLEDAKGARVAVIESEPAYLARLGLFQRGERRRLPRGAFAPGRVADELDQDETDDEDDL